MASAFFTFLPFYFFTFKSFFPSNGASFFTFLPLKILFTFKSFCLFLY